MNETFGFSDIAGTFAPISAPLSYGGGTNASGINNHGDIVGTYATYGISRGDIHGYMLSGNQYSTLTYPNNNPYLYGFQTYAYGINDKGTIVGGYSSGGWSGPQHGFINNNGAYSTLDAPGATGTLAYGINNKGVIVGSFTTGGKTSDSSTTVAVIPP